MGKLVSTTARAVPWLAGGHKKAIPIFPLLPLSRGNLTFDLVTDSLPQPLWVPLKNGSALAKVELKF